MPPPVYVEPEVSRLSQRVIVHEPEIYEKRETNYVYKETAAPPPEPPKVYDPMVETVRGPSWGGESLRSSKVRAAPPPATPKP